MFMHSSSFLFPLVGGGAALVYLKKRGAQLVPCPKQKAARGKKGLSLELTPLLLLTVCPLVFLAGFVDAVAGGGGLISLPAYLLAGLPAHLAAGTNKFAMSFGTLTAALKYLRSGKIALRQAALAALFSFGGSALGTALALHISETALKAVILLALPAVALFLFFRKGFGQEPAQKSLPLWRESLYACGIGLFIGAYDGLVGPGTGTFLILCFTSLLGYDLILSSGCAKLANLASNLASLALYWINGKVFLALAVPAALCCMLGGYLGARLAVRGGAKWVRLFIFLVLGLLFVKTGYELVQGLMA